MTIAARIKRLELVKRPAAVNVGLRPRELEAEGNRWIGILGQGPDLPADVDDRLDALAVEKFDRLVGLVAAAARGVCPGWTAESLADEILRLRRWPRAVSRFLAALPPDEAAGVLRDGLVKPVRLSSPPWVEVYVLELCHLWCRIPPGVDPGAFLRTLQTWLAAPSADPYGVRGSICQTCGLRHPGRTWTSRGEECHEPKVCGHCGTTTLGRQDGMSGWDFAWVAQADTELSPTPLEA
jgi:hypothetical protein